MQEYLRAGEKGDKRVLLVGGSSAAGRRPGAAYKRVHPKDDLRNNMHVGATRKPVS